MRKKYCGFDFSKVIEKKVYKFEIIKKKKQQKVV